MSRTHAAYNRRTWCCGEHELWTPPQKRFRKRQHRRDLRHETRHIVHNWQDEYHLNQHLEPFNWVLDDPYEQPDAWKYLHEDEFIDDNVFERDPEDYWDNYIEPDEPEEPYDFDYDPDWDNWD